MRSISRTLIELSWNLSIEPDRGSRRDVGRTQRPTTWNTKLDIFDLLIVDRPCWLEKHRRSFTCIGHPVLDES